MIVDIAIIMREDTFQVQSGKGFVMPSKSCVDCSRWVPIFSGGRCHACAAVWGAERGLPSEQMPIPCPVEGCDSFVMRRGLCDKHYRRFIDHGTTDKIRTVAEARLHPEYKNWQWLKREGKLCEEWQEFDVYIEVVGERPSPRHWADRSNVDQLYGPGNFRWTAPKLDVEYDTSTREGRQAYQQALRAQEPRYWVGGNLKRFFGITRDQYDEILASQGGTCALCERTEDTIGGDGKTRLLSVDHNHTTFEIRGLLCHSCNVGVGHFRDDPAALRLAADYLEKTGSGLFAPRPGDVISGDRKRSAHTLRADGICSVPECTGIIKALGLCAAHYARLKRNGTTESKRVEAKCSAAGCERRVQARGLCNTHYEAAYRRGELPGTVAAGTFCSADGCNRPVKAKGLCHTHYKKMLRHGSADVIHDTQDSLLIEGPPNASSG